MLSAVTGATTTETLELESQCLAALTGYGAVADEYYCPVKHPTCANFGQLHDFVVKSLRPRMNPHGRYLEVGCGAGRLDEASETASIELTDLSEGMLRHALHKANARITCRVMNALAPSAPSGRYDGVAAFMGDAYNTPGFFKRIRGVLVPGGILAITLPNHVWASALRHRLRMELDETVFILRGGGTVSVPSITRTRDDQASLLASSGFSILNADTLTMRQAPAGIPSHHVCFAAAQLKLAPVDVPLIDFFLAVASN